MDIIGIWLLVIVVLPFLLFLIRIILMTWKNIMLSRRFKNATNPADNPVLVYPTYQPSEDYSYDVYAYVVIMFVLVTLLTIAKAIVTRRKKEARRTSRRQARNVQTRPTQVTTISATVPVNSTTISDPPTTTHSDAHVKVDLPPAYDEVMKHYLEAKATAATSSQENPTAEDAIAIDICDAPPPRYNSV